MNKKKKILNNVFRFQKSIHSYKCNFLQFQKIYSFLNPPGFISLESLKKLLGVYLYSR